MSTTPIPAPNAETAPAAGDLSPREQLLQQYERLYGQQQQELAPTPTPVEPPQEPSTPQEPSLTTPPQEPTPQAAPAPPQLPQEYLDTIRSLQAELASIKQALPAPPSPPPPPDPLDHLRQGRYNEFVQAIADQVRTAVAPTTTAEAVTQALQMFRVESEVTKFLSEIRSQNPEIASMEKLGWLDAPIQQRVLAAKEAGAIKSPDDYVRVYKEAVNAEVDKARNFFQTLRAAGKQEALTTKQEVLRATPVTPQAIQTPQPTQDDPNKQETVEEYFAKRRLAEMARQRLA
jgi:hypothetical protein